MARRKAPSIPDDLLDQLLGGIDAASALNSPDWMNGLKKALAERALSAEMDYHLGDEAEAENNRNGYGRKTVSTGTGKIEIDIPRDRTGVTARLMPPTVVKLRRYVRRMRWRRGWWSRFLALSVAVDGRTQRSLVSLARSTRMGGQLPMLPAAMT